MKVNSILKPVIIPGLGPAWAKALAHAIAHQVIPSNPDGFTFNPRLNQCLALGPNTNPDLYVVSLHAHEERMADTPTERDLFRWILGRLDLLRLENHYIGGWFHEGYFYLDISVLIRGEAAAMAFGRANQQKAIFHPATGRTIGVKPTIPSEPVQGPRSTMATM